MPDIRSFLINVFNLHKALPYLVTPACLPSILPLLSLLSLPPCFLNKKQALPLVLVVTGSLPRPVGVVPMGVRHAG